MYKEYREYWANKLRGINTPPPETETRNVSPALIEPLKQLARLATIEDANHARKEEAEADLKRTIDGMGGYGRSAVEGAQPSDTTRLVPQHPLSFDSRGPEVVFLQNVLSQLG